MKPPKGRVMHSSLTFCGSSINLSDTEDEVINSNRYCLNVFFQTSDEVGRVFEKLKEGGKIIVELGPQFFSPMYGSIEDKYGVTWQLILPM
jgi:PhnB protein